MSLPKYGEYKASGLNWAEELPAHWITASLKWLCKRYSGGTPDKARTEFWENGTIPWLNSGAVNDSRIYEASAYITHEAFESSSAKWIPPGALLMALAGQGKTKGMVAQLMFESTCNQSMAAIVPTTRIDARYLYWWLTCNYQNIRNMAGGDLRDGLNLDLLGAIPCPLPLADEQTAIASFLDHETAKIDSLIAEQEKLIALLAEKRRATISHAVTKGINHTAPMRDSGVAWLGEVPAHWTVKRMRHVTELNPSKSELLGWSRETEVSFLPMEAIGEDGSLSLERTRPLSDVETGYTYFRNGDVTIAKITPCFENGKGALMVGLCRGVGFGTTELIVVRPKLEEASGAYLDWIFRSVIFRGLGEGSMYGAGGQKRVPDDFVRNFAWAFPPVEEQVLIVNFLNRESTKLENLNVKAKLGIALLKERRSALIAAAVTGKIDVRKT